MSNPTRDMLQSLHQQMMQASAQASTANQRLQEHLAKGDGLQHLLRGWRDSARTISAAVVASTGRLAKDGSDPALVKRIQARLADLVERGQGLDLARELDGTVASWEQLAIEFAQLRGYRREYLLSLLWSRKQDIDRTTAELSEARKLGGLAPQVHKQQQELSAAHQQASKKFEELRESYLKQEKELRDAEQKQAQQAKQAGAKEHLAKGPFAAGLPSVIVDPSLGATTQGKRPQAPLVIQLPKQPAGKPAPAGGVGSGGKAAPQQAGARPRTGAGQLAQAVGKAAPAGSAGAGGKQAPVGAGYGGKLAPLSALAGAERLRSPFGKQAPQGSQQASGKQAPAGSGEAGGKLAPQQAGQAPRREPFAVNVSGLRFRSAFLAGAGGGTATVDFRVKGADGSLRVPPSNPITFKFGDATVLLSRNVVLYPPDAKGEVLGWAMFVVNVQANRPLDAAETTGIRRAIEAQASSLVGSLGRLGHDASSGVMVSALSELARRYESGLSGSAPGSKPRPAEKKQSKDGKHHPHAGHRPARPPGHFSGPGAQAAAAALGQALGLEERTAPQAQARARALVRELQQAGRQLARGGNNVGEVADRIGVLRRELEVVKAQLRTFRAERVADDVRNVEQAINALGAAAAGLIGNVSPAVWARVQRALNLNIAHAQQQLRRDARAPLFKPGQAHPVPPPLPQPPRPAGKPPVPEFQVEKLNLSFARALERARTITPRGGIAGHQERDGVAERLHRTFEAMSHATSVALTDVQGGALRTSLARMDAMLGKLKGKTGADLVQGAQEVGLALGELGSLAGSKGSQQLGQLKRLLEERKGELNKLAKDVRGNAAVAIRQAGLLPQPSQMAGGAQLDTLKKLYPGLDKVLRSAAAGAMPAPKGPAGGLGGLLGGGVLGGAIGGMMGGGLLGGVAGGQLGGAIGHSPLGKLAGGAHLGGLGGAFHGGLGAFNAGALAGTIAKAARELQKAGIPQHEFGKLLGAAQKGDAGALAKNVQHLAQKKLKLPKRGGKPTKQALAEAFRELGKGGLADKILGGPIGHMMESAQRSQGQGLGGLASAFLHTAGHSKVSQAVATFEKLRTSGFKPHFSLWSKLSSAVSSAASKVTSSISNVVQKVTSNPIIKAIGNTVKQGVSSVSGFVGGVVGKVASGVSGVVNKVGGFVNNVAGKVASGLSAVTQKAMGWVKTGAGYVTQGAKWLGDKVQQGTQWVSDKVHQGVDWAKDKVHQGMEWASEKAQWAKDKLAQGAGWVGSKISQGAKRLYHAASDAWDDAKEFGKGVWDKAKGVGSDLWSKAKEKAGGLWDSVKETASGAWERVKGGASGLWDKAKAFGGKAWEAAKTVGGKAWSGIQQGASWLGDKASGLATAAWNNVKGGWNKLSSVVGAGASWLKDKAGGALDWAGKKVGSAWGAIKSGAQGAWGWVSDKVGGAWDKAKSAAGGAWDWVKGKASAAGSWIGEKVKSGVEWVNKTGIVGAIGKGLKNGISFLGKVASYTPLGALVKAGAGFVKSGGLSKLWEGTKSLASKAWGGIKKGYQAVKGFAQSPLGQGIITGLSLAASFIPGGMLVKSLVGAGIGALGAMADGKDWKQVLLAAGSGALQGALPFMKIGPLAKVGIGALQGAAGSLMAGGNWKDALKGAAGGAMDAFDLGAIKKLKGVKAAEKLLKGGQLSKIEKLTVGGSKTLQFLQKTMANPKVRRTIGAIEKVGSKAIKGGIWLSGKAAKGQDLLDKALSLGSKVDGVLQKVQENAPGVSEFFGGQDTALGRFIGKAGDYAGMGHEKLAQGLEWGQKGSELLSKGRGYLDKGLNFFGVKDPQKAYDKMMARKGARKGDKGAIELDAQQRLEKHKAKEERKQKGRDRAGKGGLEHVQDLKPPSEGALAEATGKKKRKPKSETAGSQQHAGEEHAEQQAQKPRKKRSPQKEVSLLEKAINKGKELKRKGQNLAQKGYVGLGKVQGYLEKGLEGAGKIQHGLEKASELAKQGAEFLGEDSELGKYLLQMHQKADQVHGYLETGIGYAEQVKKKVDGGREFLDGLEGVGEDYKEDPKEKKKRKKKSKTADESPLEEAQDLDPSAPKKKKRKGKKGEAEEGPKGAGHPQAEIEKKATPETEAQIKARKKLAWDLLGNISRQVQQFESEFGKATREVPKLLGENKSNEAAQILMNLGIYCDSINKKVKEASAAAKGFNVKPQDYEAEAKFYAQWHSDTKKKLYKGLAEVKGLGDHAAISGFGIDEKNHPDIFANHKHIFGLQAKVIAFADSLDDEDAKEHVAALLAEAKKCKSELQALKTKYKKDKAAYAFLTGGGQQDKLIDDVISKLSGAKAKPAGEKGEEGGKGKGGKSKPKFDLVKSAKGGLQALQDFQKKAKKYGNKASKFLGKAEKVIGKGITIGKKVDHGLQKASEYAKQIEELFGADTGIGDLAHQAGDMADKGHEKLGQALDLAKKGKAGVHKGKEILDFVLGKAHKHHAEKEEKEEKDAKKSGEEITKELEKGAKEEHAKEHKRRGHPDVHEKQAQHEAHGHRGHPAEAHEHAGKGKHHHRHHDHEHHGRGRGRKHPHHRGRGKGHKHPHHRHDHGKLDYHHQHAGKHGHEEHGPHAHHEDPGTALAKAAKEVERFSKAVHKGIAAIEKLMHAGKSSAASKKVQAISAESERARLAVTHAVSAAKHHPHLHKQAVLIRNHYLEIRGQFFKFVHTLHGLSGEVGVDLSKYPDVAAFSNEVDTFGTKVAALGDAKHGDSAMQGTVASLSKEGEALLAKGEKLAKKHSKDEAAATAVQGVIAKLRGHVQLLSGHGDKANVAKGDKELGIEHQPKPKRGRKPRRPRRRRGRGGKHHPAVEAVLEGDDARVHVEKGPNRGGEGHHDEQDVDPAAQDTWLGSGHGLMLFSEVFGGFLPAESGAHHGGGDNSGGGGGHSGGEDGEVVHHDDHGGDDDHDEGDDHDGGDEEHEEHEQEEEHHEGPGKKGRRGKRGRRRGPHRRKGKKGGGLLGKIGGWLKKTKLGKKAIGLWNKGKQFFSKMFHKLHGFADKVGGLAHLGQKWLGKGMHFAEMGMGFLNKIGAGASKVEEYAGKAEGFLNKLGLNKLAGFAGKIGGAAGWVGDKAEKGHDLLKTADQWMGKGKRGLKSVEDFTKKASKAFQQAEHFKFGGLLKLFKKSRFGDGLDGRQERARVSGSMMDDPKRLDYMTMSRMERFLGGSFAGVRIHVGDGASEVTKRYNAEAVTVKDHIFFAPGRYNPSTTEGQKLIAHELTHVMQKGRANLDVRTAEAEALHSEHSYGQGPAMRSLDLGRPAPDFKYGDGMGMGASNGLHTAKRTRSKGGDAGGKEPPSDGEEFIDLVSVRVYELLMEEMEMAFESR